MRRVLQSHFPSGSNAGLSLNVAQPQWTQKWCALPDHCFDRAGARDWLPVTGYSFAASARCANES